MRSGTSLLQHVLCTSEEANPFIHGCRYLTDQVAIYAQYAGIDQIYIKDYLGDPTGYLKFTRDILDRLLLETHKQIGEPSRLVLKSPELSIYFPQAISLLPKSRFVISVRDAKDTIASMIEVGKRHQQRGVRSFLAQAGRDIPALCLSYKRFYMPVLNAIRKEPSNLEHRLLFSRYEDLVENPDDAITRLCRFCEMSIDIESVKKGASWRTAVKEEDSFLFKHPHWSAYVTPLSGRPIAATSIGRYKKVLSNDEAAEIEQSCAGVQKALLRASSLGGANGESVSSSKILDT